MRAVLLGVSAYAAPLPQSPSLGDPQVQEQREMFGGQLAAPSVSQTRWYLDELESAQHQADAGWLKNPARLMRATRTDGVLAGVMSTRTDGLVRLPRRFHGKPEIVAALELGHVQTRSVFDEMCPPAELALLAKDGIELGVGIGELLEVDGRDFPVLVRLEPENLEYRWHENRWYYHSIVGPLPVTPGDGRWVLHTPGGRVAPWNNGLWKAIGEAWIRKTHAKLRKDNWEAKLANAARVAVAPQGATEEKRQSFFQKVMAWGVNTVFGLTPGWDVRLLESNGRGWESFDTTIEQSDTEITIAVAGQTVTTDGGAGFSNSDIHKSIRADLIKGTADALAYTVNTQILPAFIIMRFGEAALHEGGAVLEYDVTPPKDRNAEATALNQVGIAIATLTSALREHQLELDADAFATRFAVPVRRMQTNAAPANERPALRVMNGGAS